MFTCVPLADLVLGRAQNRFEKFDYARAVFSVANRITGEKGIPVARKARGFGISARQNAR